MQRAVSVVRLALSLMSRSQQKQYIMFYNTVVLAGVDYSTSEPTVYSMLTNANGRE